MWKLIDQKLARLRQPSASAATLIPTQDRQVRDEIADLTAQLATKPSRYPPRTARDAALLALLDRGRRTRRKSRARQQFIAQFAEQRSLYAYGYFTSETLRDLDYVAEQHWDCATGGFPYDRPPVTRAVECWAIMALSTWTVREIMALDIWASDELDTLGLRIDVASQLTDIAQQMLDTAALAAELGDLPTGETSDARHTRRVIGHHLAALDGVRDSVLGRLVALRTYRDRIQAAEDHTVLIARADRAHQLDGRIAALVEHTGKDTIGRTNLDVLAQGVHDATAARRQVLAEIRGEYFETFLAAD